MFLSKKFPTMNRMEKWQSDPSLINNIICEKMGEKARTYYAGIRFHL